MAHRPITKTEVDILKSAMSLLIASHKRVVNTSLNPHMKKAAETSLEEAKAVDAALYNHDLSLS